MQDGQTVVGQRTNPRLRSAGILQHHIKPSLGFGAALLPCARAVHSRMLVSVGRVGPGVAHATLSVTRKPARGGCCVGDSGLAALLTYVPWSLVHASIYRDSEQRRTVESMLARVEDVPGSLLDRSRYRSYLGGTRRRILR